MAYCPECGAEFTEEIKVCGECKVDLVDSPVQEEAISMADLEVVCTVIQEENAYILRGFLENEGIPCQLENLTFHATPAPAGGLTKVRLWVKKEDVVSARAKIAEHEQFNNCSACGHVAEADDKVCDFCGEAFERS